MLVIVLKAITPERAALWELARVEAAKKEKETLSIQIEAKTVERNEIWHKVSYILTLTNKTDAAMSGSATIQFLDSEGFVLADDLVVTEFIRPGENIFRGYVLIDAAIGPKVASTEVKVTAQ